MICLEFNWCFYDPNLVLQFSEFVWTLRSSLSTIFSLWTQQIEIRFVAITIEYNSIPFHFIISRTLPLRIILRNRHMRTVILYIQIENGSIGVFFSQNIA